MVLIFFKDVITNLIYIFLTAILVLVVGCLAVIHHDILGIQLQSLEKAFSCFYGPLLT